jgi:hypothetical protein
VIYEILSIIGNMLVAANTVYTYKYLYLTQTVFIVMITVKLLVIVGLVWCPGQNKRIAPLSFFHGDEMA